MKVSSNDDLNLDKSGQSAAPGESPESEIGKKLIVTLSSLVTSGDWDSSLFLRTTKRRIESIINEASDLVSQGAQGAGEAEVEDNFKRPAPKGYIRIYILLYQTEGNKLSGWQKTIRMLVEYNTSRPTYRNENHIKELIRSKKDIERYGYAVVNVEDSNVYGQVAGNFRDQFGHEMIVLKDNSVREEQIIGFVHANKKRYSLVNWQLVYQSDLE